MKMKKTNKKILRILQVIILIGTLVIANVLFTMVTKHHIWSGQYVLDSRVGQSIVHTKVSAKRGMILDRNDTVIAQQVQAYTLVAYTDSENVDINGKPNYVINVKKTVKSLKKVLKDIDVDNVVSIIKTAKKNGSAQTELGAGTKRLSKSTKKKIEKLKLKGIDFVETVNRSYLTTPFASNLIGFASYDEDKQKIVGKMGLEQSLNKYLAGKDGEVTYQQTVSGSVLPGTTNVLKQSENGDNVKLTIDANLQETVESAVKQSYEENNAESAWCVVMEPSTGKVLAWCSYPTFDQNEHKTIPTFTNLISESAYEPGSVMKPITYATAIDTGVYPKNETYRAGSFAYVYDDSTKKITRTYGATEYPVISDALGEDFGTISFDAGLAYSSNVGICELLANYINYKDYGKYVKKFGLYQEVGTPYINEVTGQKNLSMPMGYLNSGYGQGSSITILQLLQAYTAIFNDGKMMLPYVVDSIIDADTGKTVKKFKPTTVSEPISSDTAKQVRELMSHVLDEGSSGEKFAIDGVDMVAKTGTGEIYDSETGQYKTETFTSSIMAAAPESNPKVMVYWGMVSNNYINYSAEPFKTIMKAALVAEGVSGSDHGSNDSSEENYEKWESYEMPSLINHSLDYANQQLDGKKVNVITIGNGSNVVDQYPYAGNTINSNDHVYILTDGDTITMPNMTGWTRKDITAFWQLTGISIQTSGYGKVKSQNIEAGSTITSSSNIEVELS